MKDFLLQIMVMMMPYMKLMVYFATALMVLGLLLIILRMIMSSSALAGILSWTVGGLLFFGVFFIVCQFLGAWLGANPSIYFGNPRTFEGVDYPFWQIGGVFLAVGIVYKFLSGLRRASAA